VIPAARLAPIFAPLLLLSVAAGCGEAVSSYTTSIAPTPGAVLEPKAPDEKPAPAAKPSAETAKVAAGAAAPAPAEVKLEKLKWDAFVARITANKAKAKFTIVDAWATNCGPCKENFPHLVQMHHKYGPKGLAVVSLSLDDVSEPKDVKAAEKFLNEMKATFTNVLLDEELNVGYEKLDINAIPAVFLYGPDGKLVKKFTLDDTDNQFTYEQVEQAVAALLDGKPLPADPVKDKPKNSK